MNGIKRSRTLAAAYVTLCTTIAFSPADASSFDYGDFEGTTVMYRSVVENSVTDPTDPADDTEGLGRYGEPQIDGNILNFNVPSFFALAEDDNQTDIADGLITFGLEPVAGNASAITNLAIREFGSVNFFTFFGGNAAADAAAPMFISVTEVLLDDGTPEGRLEELDVPVVLESSLEILSDSGAPPEWNSNDFPSSIGWVAEAEVNLVDELLSERPSLDDEFPVVGVTRAQFSMNNTLTAAIDNNLAISFIDKKHLEFRPTVALVPEPNCSALMLIGMVLIRRLCRRESE